MMKLTKRQYNKEMTELRSLRGDFGLAIATFHASIGYRQWTADEADHSNMLQDKYDEFDQQIKDLEDRWQRRNWTGSDYNTYALIAQNID